MFILGIETSCDETAAAIVKNGRIVLSSIVSSSEKLHQKYGGIVPEIAAREQLRVIIPVVHEAFETSGVKKNDIDAVAVTTSPGLIGSLIVGVETAKSLSFVLDKPITPVNHLVGHIYACFLGNDQEIEMPAVALIVSGGHTSLFRIQEIKKSRNQKIKHSIELLGETLDDAAGECFDKVARLLGLSYPGGPAIEKTAKNGNSDVFDLPKPLLNKKNNFNFSFSGLKTSILQKTKATKATKETKANLAASFQKTVIEVLVTKLFRAAEKYQAKSVLLGGGVGANKLLRESCEKCAGNIGLEFFVPDIKYCVDNGVMIAVAAYYQQDFMPLDKIKAGVDYSGLR